MVPSTTALFIPKSLNNRSFGSARASVPIAFCPSRANRRDDPPEKLNFVPDGAVASAAEETSANVQTVSAGTEELSSSTAEVGRQVVTSGEIARKAVDEAGATDTTMQGLADNASRISVVVDLIQVIASQTNLLALNATIEAARRRSRTRLCRGRPGGQDILA